MSEENFKVGYLVRFTRESLERIMVYPYYESKKYGIIIKVENTTASRQLDGEWYWVDYPVAWVKWSDGDIGLIATSALEYFTHESEHRI